MLIDWKRLWLQTADDLDRIRLISSSQGEGRVAALLRSYAAITAQLLFADVNGGLDEEYEDFPDAPAIGDENEKGATPSPG